MKYVFAIGLILCIAVSCKPKNEDLDANGALLATKLENISGGGLNFSPMQNDEMRTPDIYHYQGAPYTGSVAAYDEKQRVIFTGNLKDGKAEGTWTFYYASGVVMTEGTYTGGIETGIWKNYYTKDKPKIIKDYSADGTLLMRSEFYDNGKLKNYQNIACPEYGDEERRVQFSYSGAVEYLSADRDLGKIPAAELQLMLAKNPYKKN